MAEKRVWSAPPQALQQEGFMSKAKGRRKDESVTMQVE
jgi:hypothetical protein